MCLRTRREPSGRQGTSHRVLIFVTTVGSRGVAVSSERPGPSQVLTGPSGRGFQSRLQGQDGDVHVHCRDAGTSPALEAESAALVPLPAPRTGTTREDVGLRPVL